MLQSQNHPQHPLPIQRWQTLHFLIQYIFPHFCTIQMHWLDCCLQQARLTRYGGPVTLVWWGKWHFFQPATSEACSIRSEKLIFVLIIMPKYFLTDFISLCITYTQRSLVPLVLTSVVHIYKNCNNTDNNNIYCFIIFI